MGKKKKKKVDPYNAKLILICTHADCKGYFKTNCKNQEDHAYDHTLVRFMWENEALEKGYQID